MKKILALLLAFIMVLSLCACDSRVEDVEEDEKPRTEQKKENSDDESESKASDASEPTAEEQEEIERTEPKETEEEETEPIATEVQETEPENLESEPRFQLGKIRNNTYENPFLGMGFSVDDSWYFYSCDEIAEMNGVVLDHVDSDIQDVIENATIVYDVFAEKYDGTSNININFEKLTAYQNENLDVKSNLQILEPIFEGMFQDMGFENVDSQVLSTRLHGQMVHYIHTQMSSDGQMIYQITIQVKCDGYIASIGITTRGTDATLDVLDQFYFMD